MANAKAATAAKKDTPKSKVDPKPKPAAKKPAPTQAAAKLPENATKIITNAMRRLAHAQSPANLKTLALLHENNHNAETIRKLTGVAADALEEHLGNLRRAKLIGVEKTDAGKVYAITDEGRKVWDAVKLVG